MRGTTTARTRDVIGIDAKTTLLQLCKHQQFCVDLKLQAELPVFSFEGGHMKRQHEQTQKFNNNNDDTGTEEWDFFFF